LSNLSLVKPCIDWCVQSNLQFNYEGLYIILVALVLTTIAYYLTVVEERQERPSMKWIGACLLAIIILIVAFLIFTKISQDRQVDEQITFLADRLPDGAKLFPYGEPIPVEEMMDDEIEWNHNLSLSKS